MLHCATALSVIDLCALIQNLVFVSTVLKCLVDRNWVQKLKKTHVLLQFTESMNWNVGHLAASHMTAERMTAAIRPQSF